MIPLVLIGGLPRAGKSSLCDAIEASSPAFTHVPLDRYIKPIPKPKTFLEWVATPDCVAWDHLLSHLEILRAGHHCYTPRPDWAGGWGEWVSEGGPVADGPGRRMEPATTGYLFPGTHAFAFPGGGAPLRIFVRTPDQVIANRLTGEHHDAVSAATVLQERLGNNPARIEKTARLADFALDGTLDRAAQLAWFFRVFAEFTIADPVNHRGADAV